MQAVRTKPPAAVGVASSRATKGGKKGKSCPDCQYVAHVKRGVYVLSTPPLINVFSDRYVAHVKPVQERYIATVVPTEESSSSSSHTEKTIVKYRTKYVPVCIKN